MSNGATTIDHPPRAAPVAHDRLAGRPGLEVSIRLLGTLTAEDLAAWRALARESAEPNPFQEPAFILPLVQSGLVEDALHILSVRDVATADWRGACVFQACPPTFRRPLPHLRSLNSRYSFLDSPLVHRHHVPAAFEAMFGHLRLQRTWHGARFRIQRAESAQIRELNRQARMLDLGIDHDRAWKRATTHLTPAVGNSLLASCSRSRRKSLLRARRWLEERGAVSHRLVQPSHGEHQAVDTFLELETLGWKGARGTAIASHAADLSFFRSMVQQFSAERRMLFGELLVGDQVVASTCNLVSGSALFAFKLGWNPAFAKGNPGHWAELELAPALVRERPDVTRIDSCSTQGSYVESVSSDLERMESAVYVWSRRASVLCEVRRRIRALRNGGRGAAAGGETPAGAVPP
jgi:CelD/BcsL family acetyltransferase involved in cellulose biosynthesis